MDNYYILSGLEAGPYIEDQIRLHHDAKWVGVDRGAHLLIEQGIRPHLSIGDFDSVSPPEMQVIEKHSQKVVRLPVDKDYTDTELAVLEILRENKKARIYLFNDSKSRLDHFLNILWLPIKEEFRAHAERIYFSDAYNKVSYYLPGEHRIEKELEKPVVSFAGLLPVRGLTLSGFEYPLTRADITVPTMYTSNRFLSREGCFSFDEGLLMVIQSAAN